MTDGMTRFDGGFMIGLLRCGAGREAAGRGPKFRLGRGILLVGRPDRVARLGLREGDPLDLGGDPVERLAQAQVLAERLEAAALAQRHEHLLGVVAHRLCLLADELLDLGVGHFERELLGDRLEHELARDRALSLLLQARHQLLRRLAGHGEERLERDAARLDLTGEATQQLARARLDERPRCVDLRSGDERVGCVGPELGLDLVLDLLAQARLDVGAQLGERLELARGAREIVVERRQHLLLDLLHRRREGLGLPVRELERQLLRLPGAHPDEALLDLLDDRAAAELDDVVAPRLVLGNEVDDHRVVGPHRPPLDGDELGDGRANRVELVLDELLRHLDLGDPDLELLPVGQLRLRLHGDRRGELPVLVVGGGKLEVVLRLLDRPHAIARRGVPEPAADVALDRLGHQPLSADPLQQHLARHLPFAEARNLHARREIVGRVLDGVMHVVRRNLDRQPDAVLRQLLDLRLHAVHSSREQPGEVERSRHVSAWILSLLGLAGAIWIAMFTAMVYAVRVRA